MKRTLTRRPAHGFMSRPVLAAIAGLAVASAMPHASFAQGARGGGEWRGGGQSHAGGTWRGSIGQWHGGRWYQGWHDGRYGWWWTVPGDDWYAYDLPAYPSPAYPNTGYPGAPTAPQYWYYCQSPPGYYPYVQQCVGSWQTVPAPG